MSSKDQSEIENDNDNSGIPVAAFVKACTFNALHNGFKLFKSKFWVCSSSVPQVEGLRKSEEDVDDFMSQEGNAELILRQLDEQYGKYKFMELNLNRKQQLLKKQIPDMTTSLDMLKLLKSIKENEVTLDTQFLLCDDLYVKAKIPPTEKVGLWLGANVMLEYNFEDAEDLLTKNLKGASKNLSQVESDLDLLREQLTTTEVNMARIYNWDVKRRSTQTVEP